MVITIALFLPVRLMRGKVYYDNNLRSDIFSDKDWVDESCTDTSIMVNGRTLAELHHCLRYASPVSLKDYYFHEWSLIAIPFQAELISKPYLDL